MKKAIRAAALLLTMAVVVSALTVSAFAKSDKSEKAGKSNKSGKEGSSAVDSGFAPITLDQAEEIALGHAGVEAAGAVFTKEKLDKAVYELKFSAASVKYEYEISAADGLILSCKVEGKGPHSASGSSVCPSVEAAVSPEDARQAALDAAGLSAEGLKYVVCYVSWVDHAPYAYEVKFSTRTAHYHYTIDLDSGEVLGSSCIPHR